jgi:sterol O-acyltransferase
MATTTTELLTVPGAPVVSVTYTSDDEEQHVIRTPNGNVRVKPYVSSSRNELKSALRFVPRFSSFDRENEKSQHDQFRGFFTLFWIGELPVKRHACAARSAAEFMSVAKRC